MTTETLPAAPAAPAVAEPTTPIRPSEALRLGRLIRPRRIRTRLIDGEDGACALGAIRTGADATAMTYRLMDCSAWCPYGCIHHRDDAYNTVWHLNDQHCWTDRQIVAWLESLGL